LILQNSLKRKMSNNFVIVTRNRIMFENEIQKKEKKNFEILFFRLKIWFFCLLSSDNRDIFSIEVAMIRK
jgi:hypothetical protein